MLIGMRFHEHSEPSYPMKARKHYFGRFWFKVKKSVTRLINAKP